MVRRNCFVGITAVLCIPLALLLFSTGAQAADCQCGGTEWTSSTSLPSDPGTYYLTEDITLTGTWTAPAGTTLCLNGHTISGNGTFRLIYCSGALTITNCVTDEIGGYGYWNDSGTYCFSETPPSSGNYDTLPAGILFGGLGDKNYFIVDSTNGGGIHTKGNLTLSGITIAGCTGENGGGVYAAKDLSLTNVTFVGCSGVKGSSVYSAKFLTASNCVFTNNRASGMGSALYISSDSTTAEISNCQFTGNQCTGYEGGACYFRCVSATLTNCAFTGNSARTFGGALCLAGGVFTLTDTTITGNTAGSSGGGIAIHPNNSNSSNSPSPVDLILNGGVIQDNRAILPEGEADSGDTGLGGGIYIGTSAPVTITLNGPAITGNTSSRAGGGIATASLYHPTFDITKASVTILIENQTNVTENTAAGVPSNLEILNQRTSRNMSYRYPNISLSPADGLTAAQVGISADIDKTFATGFPDGIFTADPEGCGVLLSGGNASIHRHSLGAWGITTAPTYLTPGEEARSCAHGCGLAETRALPATGTTTAEAITLTYDSSAKMAVLGNLPGDILVVLAGYDDRHMVFFTILTPALGAASATLPTDLSPDTLQAMFLTQSYQPIGPGKAIFLQ